MSTVHIVVAGFTGAGKSSLCNTISGGTQFQEGESSVSVTRRTQCEQISKDGLVIKLVDTVGFTDSNMSDTTVLQSVSEACRVELGGTVHQLLYIIRGRITEDQVNKLVEVQDSIFGPNIRGYTTVVCTQFTKFKNADAVQADKDNIQGAQQVSKIFSLAQKILHVDNPPLTDDEDVKTIALASRNTSATILLTHIKMTSLNAPYTGPFNASPISIKDKEEQLRLQHEQQAREIELLRKRQEDEDRKKREDLERQRKQLEEQQRRQEQEIARLQREAEEARRKHAEEIQRIQGNSRDTGGQVREYAVNSPSNGRYFKLTGKGRFDTSSGVLSLFGGPWDLLQQTTPFSGYDTVMTSIDDISSDCDLRLQGGVNIRNLTVGGNVTIG